MLALKFALLHAALSGRDIYVDVDHGSVSYEPRISWTHIALPSGELIEAEA